MSTETKWTPGPWRYWKEESGYCGEMVAANGKSVCVFLDDPNDKDAALIAEAPELYKALEALTGVVQSDPFLRYSEDSLYGKAIKGALAALKKARGE